MSTKPITHKPGEKFGHWTVLGMGERKPQGFTWRCRCICGKVKNVQGARLRGGRSRSCGCKAPARVKGPDNCNWKGGRTLDSYGYVLIRDHDHPNAMKKGYVFEHVLVMSRHLGRAMRPGEKVHHKNGIRGDNRLSNLELWVTGHSKGERVSDMIKWAVEFLTTYAPEALSAEAGAMLED